MALTEFIRHFWPCFRREHVWVDGVWHVSDGMGGGFRIEGKVCQRDGCWRRKDGYITSIIRGPCHECGRSDR